MKPKNGFDRLKVKNAALQAVIKNLKIDVAEKDGTIEKQANHIKEQDGKLKTLKNDLNTAETLRDIYKERCDAMLAHMGWFRRWLWNLKQQ